MKDIRNEDHFQREVTKLANGAGAHVQPFQNLEWPGVPDLSLSWNTRDFWLEVKFARCAINVQDYDKFRFDTLTAQQLDWLEKRSRHSLAHCGILGYVVIPPNKFVDYICYYPVNIYRKQVWKNSRYSVGAMILYPGSIDASHIKTGSDLLAFIEGVPDEYVVQPG